MSENEKDALENVKGQLQYNYLDYGGPFDDEFYEELRNRKEVNKDD